MVLAPGNGVNIFWVGTMTQLAGCGPAAGARHSLEEGTRPGFRCIDFVNEDVCASHSERIAIDYADRTAWFGQRDRDDQDGAAACVGHECRAELIAAGMPRLTRRPHPEHSLDRRLRLALVIPAGRNGIGPCLADLVRQAYEVAQNLSHPPKLLTAAAGLETA